MKITFLISKTAFNYGYSLDATQLECNVTEVADNELIVVIGSVMLSSSVHAYKFYPNTFRYHATNLTTDHKELERFYPDITQVIADCMTYLKTADYSMLPDSYTVFSIHKRKGNHNVVVLEY